MFRPKPGRLGAGALVLVSSMLLLGVAGCGGSSSSSSTSTTARTETNANTNATGAAFAPVLLREQIVADASESMIYAPAPTLSGEKAAISNERDALYTANLAVRKLKAPPAAQRALVAYLTQSGKAIAGLDRLSQQPSFNAIHSMLDATVTPQLKQVSAATKALRTSLGLPQADPWLQAKPLGPTIYTDSLSAPHGKIKWLMGPNVRYADGGLEVSAVPRGNGQTGPATPYTFDGRHISVEVDAKAIKGDPYFGVGCPPASDQPDAHLVGQIGPGAKWSVGLLHQNSPSYLLRPPVASSAVKVGQTNHVRIDCDQWRPGLTTLRLYVNGQFLGAASARISLKPQYEAGVTVVSSGPAAAARFTNWRVSQLTGS